MSENLYKTQEISERHISKNVKHIFVFTLVGV